MELIRINENKVKIMLNATDMDIYDLPSEGIDCCESTIRDAFRAVLRDVSRKCGMNFSDGRLSIQFYPSKGGGCEMFVTINQARSVQSSKKEKPMEQAHPATAVTHAEELRWNLSEAFAFDSMKWLLTICAQLKRIGYQGASAAFRDENNRCFLILESCGAFRPLITEYGTEENPKAVRLYISEHGSPICTTCAVETLGAL